MKVKTALVFVLLLVMGAFLLPPRASATATDTHFAVLSDAACSVGTFGTDADCWSHTSGGAGGAGVPGGSNDVTFDANSGPPSGQSGDVGDTGAAAMSVDAMTFSSCPTRTYTFDQAFSANSIAFTSGTCNVNFGSAESSMTLTMNGDITGACCTPLTADVSTLTWTTGLTASLSLVRFGYMTVPASTTITMTGSTAPRWDDRLQVDGTLTTPGVQSGVDFLLMTNAASEPLLDVGPGGNLNHGSVTIRDFEMLTNADGVDVAVEIESWSVYAPLGPTALDLVMSVDAGGPDITFVIGGISTQYSYDLLHDGVLIATDANRDTEIRLTDTTEWGGSSIDERIQIVRGFFYGGDDGDGGVGEVGGGGIGDVFTPGNIFVSPFGDPNELGARCLSLGSFDWILPTVQTGSKNVTIQDTRRVASLVIQYLVSWGDKTTTTATTAPITHAYSEERVYTITLRIAYQTGAIEVLTAQVDLRGNNCSLQNFMEEWMPIFAGLAGLLLVTAIIVQLTKRSARIKAEARRRLRRWLLGIFLAIIVLMLLVVLYASAVGVPI